MSDEQQGVTRLAYGAVAVHGVALTAGSRIMLEGEGEALLAVLGMSPTEGWFTVTSSDPQDQGAVAWRIFEPEPQRTVSRWFWAGLVLLGAVLGAVASLVLPTGVCLAAATGWWLGYFGRDWEQRRRGRGR